MYKVLSVLLFEGKPVALRVNKTQGDTGWQQDVELGRLKGLNKSLLKKFPTEDLVDYGNGVLITAKEFKGKYIVKDVSDEAQEVSRIQRLLFTPTDSDTLQKVCREVFNEIVRFGEAKVHNVKPYVDAYSGQLHHGYRVGATLKSSANFLWNNDHEYCERQYDAWGVIDDCPLFDKWEAYGRKIVTDFTNKYPVSVDFELRGVKHELTLSVTVKSDCILG